MKPTESPAPAAPPIIDPPVAHLERKAAALLLLTLCLVVGAGLYLLYARGVFEPTQSLVLTSDDSDGVVVGMDVTFSGFAIGRVKRLDLAPDGNVRIYVEVPRKDAHWLRESSVFTLVKGIVGGTTIKAYSGILTDPPMPPNAERPVLRGDATAEIPQIMAAAKELLGNMSQLTSSGSALGQTLEEVRHLSRTLNGPQGAMGVLLGGPENAAKSVQMLDQATALLARMEHLVTRADQQVFDRGGVMPQVQQTVAQLNSLLAETRGSLRKVDSVLENAQSITHNVDSATADLGQLRAEVEANLRKIEALIADVQRKWPFAHQPALKLP